MEDLHVCVCVLCLYAPEGEGTMEVLSQHGTEETRGKIADGGG